MYIIFLKIKFKNCQKYDFIYRDIQSKNKIAAYRFSIVSKNINHI